ncbi:hypothetical protein C8R44DRAFT_887503 [Mycena epipterygia]|nr:hypothetical protein C8R44DRAFT_887503 [Mycena epipterygia]
MDGISPHHLISFLERSSPPLLTLTLPPPEDLDFVQLEECLSLAPTITDFVLHAPTSRLLNPLFSALADPTHRLLPELRTMKIPYCSVSWVQISYETLFRALSVRRNQTVCFELKYDLGRDEEEPRPNEDMCTALRKLVADGMKIYIGTEYQNFI